MFDDFDVPSVDGMSDHDWLAWSFASFESMDWSQSPIGPHIAKRSWASRITRDIRSERVPGLIVSLFDCYDDRKDDAFNEMMLLVESLYIKLPPKLEPSDACSIIAATRHTCGHGRAIEPIELAKVAFAGRSFTPELFAAVRQYRDRLSSLHSSQITSTLGEIAVILWQDPHEPLKPKRCLSSGIRNGFHNLESSRREAWSGLLACVDRTARRKPDKAWVSMANVAVRDFGERDFMEDFAEWLTVPSGKVALSTGGRHVLKSLIWMAALCGPDRLDEVLPMLVDLEYASPTSAAHLIYAIAYWLDSRPDVFAEPHRERLRSKWPKVGDQVLKKKAVQSERSIESTESQMTLF